MSIQFRPVSPGRGHYLYPLLLSVLLFICTCIIWWTITQQEQVSQHQKIMTEASHFSLEIKDDIDRRISSLQRVATRWEMRGGIPKDEFINDINDYMVDTPGFQAVEYVDPEFIIRWIVPLEGNEKALNLNLAFEYNRRMALFKAKNSKSPTISRPVSLVQGGKGFLIYIPLYAKGEFNGFILAAFNIETWMKHLISVSNHNISGLRFAINFDDDIVFRQLGWSEIEKNTHPESSKIELSGHKLELLTLATYLYHDSSTNYAILLIPFAGFIFSVLIGAGSYLLQKSLREKKELNRMKIMLESEVKERTATEAEYKGALTRLEIATHSGGFGIWTWNILSGEMLWDEQMYHIHALPTDAIPTYENWCEIVHPSDRALFKARMQYALDGKAVFNIEFRINKYTDDETRQLSASARVIRDNGGKAVTVTGLCQDITRQKQTEEILKQQEEQVRTLLNSTAEAIYGINLAGDCTFANATCARLLGYSSPETLLGKNMHELIHHSFPDGSHMAADDCHIYQALHQNLQIYRDDEVLWRADGTSFPAEYWAYPQETDDIVTGAVVTFNDITVRKQIEADLARERQRLSFILEGTNVGTWEWYVQTGEVVFNDRWADIVGYRLEELRPITINTWMQFAHPDDLKVSGALLEKHFNKEIPYYECEARMRHKDGRWVWVLDRGRVAQWDSDGKPLLMCGTHQDITRRKYSEERAQHLANHDELTGLPNMRLARERLIMGMKLSNRNHHHMAIMYIDLDGFKKINDTHGHDVGDQVLRVVAKALNSTIRQTDTAARLGGDEFLMLITEIHDRSEARLVAEKIVEAVSRPINLENGQQVSVGASIGIALYPDDADDAEKLLKKADDAMFFIKASGKNNFAFTSHIAHDVPEQEPRPDPESES